MSNSSNGNQRFNIGVLKATLEALTTRIGALESSVSRQDDRNSKTFELLFERQKENVDVILSKFEDQAREMKGIVNEQILLARPCAELMKLQVDLLAHATDLDRIKTASSSIWQTVSAMAVVAATIVGWIIVLITR